MVVTGFVTSFGALLLVTLLILRGVGCRHAKLFPLFYSYLIYLFCSTVAGYVVYWTRPSYHASVYWFSYVLSIVVEFAVLAEISDHIFQPFPAIRNLGRALMIAISLGFGAAYILPTILRSHGMQMALLDFALRASLTKAVILVALFYAAHHFGLRLGRNVAGLMLGFSIYLGVNIANFACVENFGNLYASILWVMSPIAYTLCLLVWTGALWEFAPMPGARPVPAATEGNSEKLVLELARFNNAVSRFLNK
jgi:hypothetical protein